MSTSMDTGAKVLFGLFWLLIAVGVTTAVVGITQTINAPHDYARGYCAALGGTVLNNDTCDVGGAVVLVKAEGT